MATPAVRADTGTHAEDERFWVLVCSDVDLLRAEFDEIIATGWPASPPPTPHAATAVQPRPVAPHRREDLPLLLLATRPRHPVTGRWGRQRSPPPDSC
jgi:hypothetical protein